MRTLFASILAINFIVSGARAQSDWFLDGEYVATGDLMYVSHSGNEEVPLLLWDWKLSTWILLVIPPAQSVALAAPPNDNPVYILRATPTRTISITLVPG